MQKVSWVGTIRLGCRLNAPRVGLSQCQLLLFKRERLQKKAKTLRRLAIILKLTRDLFQYYSSVTLTSGCPLIGKPHLPYVDRTSLLHLNQDYH